MNQVHILEDPGLTLVSLFFSLEVVPMVAVTNEHVLGLDIKRVEECVPTLFQLGLLPSDNSPVFVVCYVSS